MKSEGSQLTMWDKQELDRHTTYLGLQFCKQLSKAKSSQQQDLSSFISTALTSGKMAPDSFWSWKHWYLLNLVLRQFNLLTKENHQFWFVSGLVAFMLVSSVSSLKGPVVRWSVVSCFCAETLSHFCRSWHWNMLAYTEQLGLLLSVKWQLLLHFGQYELAAL